MDEKIFCPLYKGEIRQYDCDEISFGAKNGYYVNDGLPFLIDIDEVKSKNQFFLSANIADS